MESGDINEALYNEIKPRGSQPARLYGLAKVHKNGVPVRPVLSMPGSAYHRIAMKVSKWLSVVDECKIQSSTQAIATSLGAVELDDDEVLVSFDVSSLYTNVPVHEAIDVCTNFLFSGKYETPPVSKETFKKLLTISTCDVLMLTHDGYYRQKDGLAMGSPPAPPLANGWLFNYDHRIRDNAKLYSRYMDDIIRSINKHVIDSKLREINNFHPCLKFTIEKEVNGELPFLDMKVLRSNGKLSSTWYTKPTDTGLIMNFHAVSPIKYKKSVVTGFVHRIYRACSSWKYFHESLTKAKSILDQNQYPKSFYEPLINRSLDRIINQVEKPDDEEETTHKMFLQYRGQVTEDYLKALNRIKAPCKVILTLRKMKTVLPSLKSDVEKALRSRIVYKITCSRCSACYVGQTDRHFSVRFKEHIRPSQPIGKHIRECGVNLDFENKDQA